MEGNGRQRKGEESQGLGSSCAARSGVLFFTSYKNGQKRSREKSDLVANAKKVINYAREPIYTCECG